MNYLSLASVVLPALAADAADPPGRMVLIVTKGPPGVQGQRLALDDALIQIGRSELVHLRFDLPTLSRLHAALSRTARGHWILHDLRSSNGTFLNGRRIAVVPVTGGDEISLGPDLVMRLAGQH